MFSGMNGAELSCVVVGASGASGNPEVESQGRGTTR